MGVSRARNRGDARGSWSAYRSAGLVALVCAGAAVPSCRSPESYRAEADRVAAGVIEEAQTAAVGRTEPFTIERPEETLRRRLIDAQVLQVSSETSGGARSVERVEHWPDDAYLDESRNDAEAVIGDVGAGPLTLGLLESLAVGARNSREYQAEKERVFIAALALDLARDDFRPVFSGGTDVDFLADLRTEPDSTVGIGTSPSLSFTRRLENGLTVAGAIGVDIVRLFTLDSSSSLGLFGDLSVTVPLMRGSGRHIVREPLTQAERNAVYAIYDFERFKRVFAVGIASDYLGVLQAQDQVTNAEQNYRSLISAASRLRRLADEGRSPEIEVDQAVQNELQARDRWISARQTYERALDRFRITLGLPVDAQVVLDREEIVRLGEAVRETMESAAPPGAEPADVIDTSAGADAEIVLDMPSSEGGGPFELEEGVAVALALGNRLDLRRAEGVVVDAQRGVVIAADQLRAEVTLSGSSSLGERRSIPGAAAADSASLRFEDGSYDALLSIDLPLERTFERNQYRQSLISFESSVRSLQALEDRVKSDVRDRLRTLLTSREGLKIQAAAVELADRRVESTRLFLETGRAQTRDLLEAQDDLLSAQNALTTALVNYRIAELELQRDMGVLAVNEDALWTELDPGEIDGLLEDADRPAGELSASSGGPGGRS